VSKYLDLVRLLSDEAVGHARLSDGSGVVLDVDAVVAYAVNDTGMCLVEGIREGALDRQMLVERLVREFDVDAATAAADIDEFVLGLLEVLEERSE
jgi:hypothetical protein